METDGCTLFPDGNWYPCCVAHDYAYADGGGLIDKLVSDFKLMRCIWRRGKLDAWRLPVNFVAGIVAFIGLTIGGYWNFRWTKVF